MPKHKLPATEVLAELYESGMSLEEIGDKYGVSRQAVSLRLSPLGITRPAGRPGKTEEQQYIELLEATALRVLDFHQTPGDPAYQIAYKALPGLVPEKELGLLFEDDVS